VQTTFSSATPVATKLQTFLLRLFAELQPQWEQFIPKKIEGCRARHERLGLPEKYLDGLNQFLRDATTLIPVNATTVVLTGSTIWKISSLRNAPGIGSWRHLLILATS
jgi:hygromycin-B 7''-O-kinase